MIQQIVRELPKAWLNSEFAMSEIIIDSNRFVSNKWEEETVKQSEFISLNGQRRGQVAIHYPARLFELSDFLKEENLLLKNIARELANIIHRNDLLTIERQYDRKIRQNDRLIILGEITAGIAHELNTPLANILGFAQFIEKKSTDNVVVNDAKKIVKSALYSRDIVKKMMLFSCDLPQTFEKRLINDTIEETIALLQSSLKESRIKIYFKPRNKIELSFDPLQISQVFFNLILNAIKASNENSTIEIRISKMNNFIVIDVIDEGIGIEEKLKHKIFEPFFTTSNDGEGTGLGLSVVHGIIKAHRGEISVKNNNPVGTIFSVKLPLN
jgi:signal transduction histidine kinase